MAKLLVFLLFTSLSAIAQIPKKASKIIITNNLQQKDNFKTALTLLVDNGYIISKADTLSGTILTEPSESTNAYPIHRIHIIARHNKTTVSGQINLDPEWTVIENRGMKGSPTQKAFIQLNTIASKLPGNKTYE